MAVLVVTGMLTGDNVTVGGRPVATEQIGGGGVYAAVGARLWQRQPVALVALAGADYPQAWIDQVAGAGIDVSGIRRVPGPHCPSLLHSDESFVDQSTRHRDLIERGPAWVSSDEHDYENPEDSFSSSPEDLPEGIVPSGVHLAPMGADALRRWVTSMADGTRSVTLDSPWWVPGRPAHEFTDMLAGVTCLLPSRSDVEHYFGRPFQPEMMRELAALGPRVVVARLGADGCLVHLRASDQYLHVPAFGVVAKDVTGAGDSFCGAFLSEFVDTEDAIAAAIHGTVAASFVVESYGALAALAADRQEIERRRHVLGTTLANTRSRAMHPN